MILRANWIVPVSRSPIRNGFVQVEGKRIAALGAADSLSSADRRASLDLGESIITPGLINAHTHLELTCYAGALPPAPFWNWIERLIPLRASPEAGEIELASAAVGAWQSLRVGVTCVGDVSRCGVSWQALKHVPIRKVCFAELMSIASQPPRTPDELCAAIESVEEDELLTVGFSPHAPYSVTDEHLSQSIALARQSGRPWCAHWAETREEVAFIRGRADALPAFFTSYLASKGLRPPCMRMGEYLAHVADRAAPGVAARFYGDTTPGILAHGNYFDEDEFPSLATRGHTIAYCPRAHRFFGHSPHPLPQMLAAGVQVILATDSAASNESLSVLEEARFVKSQLAAPPPNDALIRMITIDAATALGLGRDTGSLEPGKLADIAAFSCGDSVSEPLAAMLTHPVECRAVWVAGDRVI
ncbi:MAG: amidohydrolase family protein [Phycisphaerales bacterium]|nr:amidohydrolase family protein [Phycisphaerales bacterium]